MEDTCCIVSKSLIKVHKEVIEREQDFCLGLIGWCPCSECTPRMETTREKKCLRLKWKRPRYCEIEDASLRNSVEERVASSVGTEEPSDNVDLFDFSITSQDLSKSIWMEKQRSLLVVLLVILLRNLASLVTTLIDLISALLVKI